MLDFIQKLPLVAMFAVCVAIGLAFCWLILFAVRACVRASGFDPSHMLPMRDTMIGAVSTVFALMVAFSAAGIWNDTLQASTAVQRESNALENVYALATSLPTELSDSIRDSVARYGRLVVESDWPAMVRKVPMDNPVYEKSDQVLIDLINRAATEQSRAALPTLTPLLNQVMEARNARLVRITLANSGVSVAQWTTMLLIALGALVAVALCHNHHFGTQVLATNLYALAAAAAFFVILAHDRPFVGVISVSPAPIIQLVTPH
jgi:hypothetical protein